jgi:hypothetical protein
MEGSTEAAWRESAVAIAGKSAGVVASGTEVDANAVGGLVFDTEVVGAGVGVIVGSGSGVCIEDDELRGLMLLFFVARVKTSQMRVNRKLKGANSVDQRLNM